jgi:hypothetical protein
LRIWNRAIEFVQFLHRLSLSLSLSLSLPLLTSFNIWRRRRCPLVYLASAAAEFDQVIWLVAATYPRSEKQTEMEENEDTKEESKQNVALAVGNERPREINQVIKNTNIKCLRCVSTITFFQQT